MEKNVDDSNAKMHAKLDRILSLLEKQDIPLSNNVTNNNTDILKSLPFPLTEYEQIHELELKLIDPQFKRKMVNYIFCITLNISFYT